MYLHNWTGAIGWVVGGVIDSINVTTGPINAERRPEVSDTPRVYSPRIRAVGVGPIKPQRNGRTTWTMDGNRPLANNVKELSVPEICLEDVNEYFWRIVAIQPIASNLLVHSLSQNVPLSANEPAIKAWPLSLPGTFCIDFPDANTFAPHPMLVP